MAPPASNAVTLLHRARLTCGGCTAFHRCQVIWFSWSELIGFSPSKKKPTTTRAIVIIATVEPDEKHHHTSHTPKSHTPKSTTTRVFMPASEENSPQHVALWWKGAPLTLYYFLRLFITLWQHLTHLGSLINQCFYSFSKSTRILLFFPPKAPNVDEIAHLLCFLSTPWQAWQISVVFFDGNDPTHQRS